jgi:ABC-type multidrug transport system fused ATPase/permease subunit
MRTWLRFLSLLKPYRRRLGITFLGTLARPLLNAAKIYLLKLIVDNLVNPTSNIVLIICGGYLAIALAKGIASYIDQYFGAYVGGRVVIDLRHMLFSRLLRLSLRYHNSHRVGESISRLVSDVGAVEDVLVAGITDGATQVLTVIIFAAMLFYLDPFLALISLLVLPILFATLLMYARRSRFASREVRVRLAELTSAAEESLSALGLVKSFMRFKHEEERLRVRGEHHWKARLDVARQRALFIPLSDIVATIGTVLVVYFGAQALAAGTLTIGGLVIFLAYLGQLYNPLLSLSRLGNSMQGGLAAAERVAGLLDLPASDDEPSAATLPWHTSLLQAKSPAISFDHVSFAYTPGQPVLRDFSLTIPRGSIVALVGASGGGKSTAVALLQRLYEPESGRIRVFGHDLRELDTLELRQQMAVVPQEISLFMGSLKENIVYGRLEANDEAIIRAARQAGILDMKLTDGLNTMIGPRGTKLSGGQRQRVAIARALVREAPILIFDEATSALDTLSEERIRTTLETLREQHTILLVAHRLSTVRSADLIVVMEQGCAVESGTHDDLIRRGGVYAALVQGQYNADIAKQTTTILSHL